MSGFRRAAKTDSNQTEIVALFRQLGWSVLIISQLKNCCDIIVAKHGRTVAIEIKDGAKVASKRKLTPGEIKFFDGWKGEKAIITSQAGVLNLNKSITNHSVNT